MIAIAIGIAIAIEIEIEIEIDSDPDSDSDLDFVGGTGNSLPVLRSNKRLLLKAPFVPMKAETLCPLGLISPFVENLVAFGHRHKCRWHPGNQYRYPSRTEAQNCTNRFR
jgi:hypothetical protein